MASNYASKVLKFKEVIHEGCPDTCVSKKYASLLTSDLAFLTAQNWLNLQIIEVFVKLINKSSQDSIVFTLTALKCFLDRDNVQDEFRKFKMNGVKSVCIIINVWKDTKKQTEAVVKVVKEIIGPVCP